jgi:hypothetical protein
MSKGFAEMNLQSAQSEKFRIEQIMQQEKPPHSYSGQKHNIQPLK